MKSLQKFFYESSSYRNFYCRICGRLIKKDEGRMTMWIHQRVVGVCISHFNNEIKDEAMIENL